MNKSILFGSGSFRLRFNENQIVVMPYVWGSKTYNKAITFKTILLENPNILSVSATGEVLGRMMTAMAYKLEGMADKEWGGELLLL